MDLKRILLSFSLVFVVNLLYINTTKAENPPYATVDNGSAFTDLGSDYQFIIELNPNNLPDCGLFISDCDNGSGIAEVDIIWEIYQKSCTGCGEPDQLVASGTIEHGFWGTNCLLGSIDNNRVDCATPGGCGNELLIPKSTFCPGVTYEFKTYAFNPNLQFGIGENSTVGPGPYTCCTNEPSFGSLAGMEDCSFDNGGTGWLNPSYPQSATFTAPSDVSGITIAPSNNLPTGDITCGFDFNSTVDVTIDAACSEVDLTYTLSINGTTVETSSVSCVSSTDSYTASSINLLSCVNDPSCTFAANSGNAKVECGSNTLRWEVVMGCSGNTNVIEFEESTFTVDCVAPEDPIIVGGGSAVLCDGTALDIGVQDTDGEDFPAGYDLHFFYDNNDPFNNPTSNYLGSINSESGTINIANDGTIPPNQSITIIGALWENYPNAPLAECEALTTTLEITLLSPITLTDNGSVDCTYNEASVTADGGLPDFDGDATGYTYTIASESLTNTTGLFTGLAGGNYTVEVTDDQGCMESIQVTVFEAPNITFDVTASACDYGDIEVATTGGSGNWTYYLYPQGVAFDNGTSAVDVINNANATDNFIDVAPGDYTIYIENDGECGGFDPEDVTVYEALSLTQSDICTANQITVSATGGYTGGNYDYTIASEGLSNTTGVFSGLAAGNYTVEVNDNNPEITGGCSFSLSIDVYDPLTLDYTYDACNNPYEIIIDDFSGGNGGPYTVNITRNPNTLNPALDNNGQPLSANLTAGDLPYTFDNFALNNTYYIVITDGQVDDNTGPCIYAVGPLDAPTVPSYTPDFSTCDDNTINGTIFNGDAPYDIYLYPQGDPLAGAPPTYDPAAATAGAATDGSGNALVISGNTDGNVNFSDVPAGTYTIYIIDANQCAAGSLDVVSYDPLDLAINAAAACSGAVEVTTANGGTGVYTVFVSTTPAPGAVADVSTDGSLTGTGSITGIADGSYHVVLQDSRNCQISEPFSTTAGGTLTLTSDICANELTVDVAGGSPDWDFYLYNASGNFDPNDPENAGNGYIQTDAGDGSGSDISGSFTSLSAGTYSIYAIDANGCTGEILDLVINPPLDLSVSANEVSCGEAATVTIDNVSGGDGNYSVYLSNTDAPNGSPIAGYPISNGSTPITDVAAGNYFAIVEDGNNCQFGVAINVNSLDDLALEVETTNASCGLDDGTVTITNYGGGQAPYSIFLSTTPAPNGSPISGLGTSDGTTAIEDVPPGDYFVVIEDSESCQFSVPITIEGANNDGTLTAEQTCEGETIIVNASGGTPDWTFYLYLDGSSFDPNDPENAANGYLLTDVADGGGSDATGTFIGIPAANVYEVYAIDAGGCATGPISVQSIDALVLEASNECGQDIIEVTTVSGGTTPYTVTLETTSGTSVDVLTGTGTFSGVAPGDYNVVFTDANDCSESIGLTVGAAISLTQLPVEACIPDEIEVVANGGTGWTFYLYTTTGTFDPNNPTNPANGYLQTATGTSPSGLFTDVTQGDYVVYALDGENCQATPLNASVSGGSSLEATNASNICDYNLVTIQASGGNASNYNFGLYNTNDELVSISPNGLFANQPAGTYYVIVTDADNCTSTVEDVVILDTDLLDMETPYDCDAGFVAIGGVGPYTYDLYELVDPEPILVGSNSTGIFPDLSTSANYQLIITDANNCTIERAINCTENCDLAATLESTSCVAEGSFEITINLAGTGTYTIAEGSNVLLTGQTAGSILLPATFTSGTVDLVITDENIENCSQPLSVTEDCSCDLDADYSTSCIDGSSFEALISITGSDTYTVTYDDQTIEDVVAGDLPLTLANGDYTITITSNDRPFCSETITISEECVCDLNLIPTSTCVSVDVFVTTLVIEGTGTYNVSTDGEPFLENLTATSIPITFENGTHVITVTDVNLGACTETIEVSEDCFDCELVATPSTVCIDDFTYNVLVDLEGNGTYTITYNGNTLTNISSADSPLELGPFDNGSYAIIVTSDEDPECVELLDGENDCFECDLSVTPITECNNLLNYNVLLDISGDGTFLIDDGNGGQIFAQPAATGIPLGPYTNGTYTITVTSELDGTCVETIVVEEDCFECANDFELTNECNEDGQSFDVTIIGSGIGTYSIDDGQGNVLTDVVLGGSYPLGDYPNGAYTVVITSEFNPECTVSIDVENDCFICELDQAIANVECESSTEFQVNVDFPGEGFYDIEVVAGGTVDDISGATSGSYFFGPFEADAAYEVIITSIDYPDCTTTLSGISECFECELNVNAVTECLDLDTYLVTVNFDGPGTYTLDDGLGNMLTGLSSGSETFGPYTGPYNIAVISETDEQCDEILTGTPDCFDCDLDVISNIECVDETGFIIDYTIIGSGTFTVTDNDGNITPGVEAGNYSIDQIPSGIYNILIVSENDPNCRYNITGTQDCFDCDLDITANTTCIDDDGYNISLEIEGTGLFTINLNDGLFILDGQTSGTYDLGNLPNGPYSIVVTSELDPNCSQSIGGLEDCTPGFECDLETNIDTECVSDTAYDLIIEITGSDNYSIVETTTGENIANVTEGQYIIPNIPNGPYEVAIVSDQDADCGITLSGSDDCTPDIPCDPSATFDTECISLNEYEVLLSFSGTGTYIVTDANSNNIISTIEDSGDFTFGPFPNGSFTLVISNEEDPNCAITVTGENTCDYNCDFTINSEVVCSADSLTYTVVLDIVGDYTYTINDQTGNSLTGVEAGTIELGPYPNGFYNIEVINESNTFCFQNLAGQKNCIGNNSSCDLTIDTEVTCADGGESFTITLTITGSSSYNVYFYNFRDEQNIFNATAGVYTFTANVEEDLPYYYYAEDTYFSIFVEDANNFFCTEGSSGNASCDCDLNVDMDLDCAASPFGQITVEIEGNSTYDIYVYGDWYWPYNQNVLSGVSAGTYVFDSLYHWYDYFEVYVQDTENPQCYESLFGFEDCAPNTDCEFELGVIPRCENDLYYVDVTITEFGNNQGSTYGYVDNWGNTQSGLSPGTYTFGPFDEQNYYYYWNYINITVYDENSGCAISRGLNANCDEECQFEMTTTQECDENGDAFVTVSIVGDGTYNIYASIGEQIEVPAGEYTFGPFPDDYIYFISVVNVEYQNNYYFYNCFQEAFFHNNCAGGGESCDLNASINLLCDEETGENYFIEVTLTGSDDNYTIQEFFSDTELIDLSAGTYTIGPLINGSYGVRAYLPNDNNCYFEFNGSNFCSPPPPCDLSVTSDLVCLDDDSAYNLVLNISGTSEYSIFYLDDVIAEGLTGDTTYVIENIRNNDFYYAYIQDENNSDCNQEITGVFGCAPPPPCSIDAVAIPYCLDDGSFVLEVTIPQDGNFNIFVNGQDEENVGKGTYAFGPIYDDFYEVYISNNNPDQFCDQFIGGGITCEDNPPTGCNVSVEILYVECDEGTDTYTVHFNINGTGTYDIYSGLYVEYPFGTDLIEGGLLPGKHQVSGLENGPYDLLLIDTQDDDCFYDFVGYYDCNDPEECSLLPNIIPICNADGTFSLEITINTKNENSTYEILIFEDVNASELVYETNVPPGRELYGPFEGDSYYVYIEDENNEFCNLDGLGVIDCTEPAPICDLDILTVFNCIPDSNILLTNVFIQEGSDTYSIYYTDDPFVLGGPPGGNLPDLSDLALLQGGATSGNNYEFWLPVIDQEFSILYILVISENNDDCYMTNVSNFNSTEACNPDNPCLFNYDVDQVCLDDGEYVLEVTVRAEGTYTIVVFDDTNTGGPGNDLLGFEIIEAPGTFSLGPFEAENYSVGVIEGELLYEPDFEFLCGLIYTGTNNCNIDVPPPPCNLEVDMTFSCDESGESVTFVFFIQTEGTYSIYEFGFGGLDEPILSGLQGGTGEPYFVTLDLTDGGGPGGPPLEILYFFEIVDENNNECFVERFGTHSCGENNPCADYSYNVNVNVLCNEDGSYNLEVEILHSGNEVFDISEGGFGPGPGGGDLLEDDVPPGIYTIGPYTDDFYEITVSVEDDDTFGGFNICQTNLQGAANCEGPPPPPPATCDLIVKSEVECDSDNDQYYIVISITGSGTYDLYPDFSEPLTGLPEGEYKLGPYETFYDDFGFYSFYVEDTNLEDCFYSTGGSISCSGGNDFCNLQASATLNCENANTYTIEVVIEGNGTYTLTDQSGNTTRNLEAGTYTVGPFSNINYDIFIQKENDFGCFQSLSGSENCEDPPPPICDLSVEAIPECIDPETYNITIRIVGSDTYSISNLGEVLLTGQTQGEIDLGVFGNGNYNIVVTNESNADCTQSIVGIKQCTEPQDECDLNINVTDTRCIDENNYELTLNITGGSTYTIDDGQGGGLSGLSTASIAVGPFPNGPYSITVTDEVNANCTRSIAGFYNCLDPVTCDLGVTTDAYCLGDGTFEVVVNITGSSSYTIEDGVHPSLLSQPAGEYTFGPFDSGSYTISVADGNDPSCSLSLPVSLSCQVGTVTIGEMIFMDDNGNGILDEGENGAVGVMVHLYDTNGELVAEMETDDNGNYLFENIPSGTYYIVVDAPINFVFSPQDQGDDEMRDSDVNNEGTSDFYTFADNEVYLQLGAGFYPNPACEEIVATVNPICPENEFGRYYIAVAFEGGEAPYQVVVNDNFTFEITSEKAGIDELGPFNVGTTYKVEVIDASGCYVGFFEGGPVFCAKLAVDLVSFNGEVLEAGNQLEWVTASQVENAFFTLMRSTDGDNFEPIYTTEGAGTSTETLHYDFLDKDAPSGLSYYRLDMEDYDGKITSSVVVSLFRGETDDLSISTLSPVPVQDWLQIEYNVSDANLSVSLTVYDLLGRTLFRETLQPNATNNTHRIDLSAYPSAPYILTLERADQRVSQKIVKE